MRKLNVSVEILTRRVLIKKKNRIVPVVEIIVADFFSLFVYNRIRMLVLTQFRCPFGGVAMTTF